MVARYSGPTGNYVSGSASTIVVSSSLPGGAATEAKQNTTITVLGVVTSSLATITSSLTLISSSISLIEQKLPTLGIKATSGSISVTLSSDHAPVPVSTPEYSYQTIRSTVGTGSAGDTEPPTTGFVVLSGSTTCPYAEFIWNIGNVSGTVSPSQVTFRTWNRVGGTIITKVDEFVIDSSYLVLPSATNPLMRRIVPNNADEVYMTFTFPDGTSPTLSGTIYGRAVTDANLQRKDFTFNQTTGHMIFEPRGYDSPSNTVGVSQAYVESDLYLEEPLVVSTTALTANTEYYYPSSDGILMGSHDSVSWEYYCQAGAAGTDTVQIWWEATHGSNAWTQRNIITKTGYEQTSGSYLALTPLVSTISGTIQGLVNFSNPNVTRMRAVVKPIASNSRTVTISMRRKVR